MATKVKLTAKDKEAIEQERQRDEDDSEQLREREMFYSLFQDSPVFEQLDTALKNGSVFHAYLFHGPKGSVKEEAARLFAASIMTDSNGLLKETDASEAVRVTAAQIYHGDHSDFIYLNGNRKEAIKKEEVDEIQRRFSHTASTASGRKVYVISHAENSSLGAMNGLLKFLEEPADNGYAILTADNVERVLPTIRSRCILIPFQPLGKDTLKKLCQQQGLDEEDVHFISSLALSASEIAEVSAGRSYQTAKKMLKQYLNVEGSRDLLFVDYEYRYRSKADKEAGEGVRYKDARDENLDTLNMFFSLLLMAFHDALKNDATEPAWYHKAVNDLRRDADFIRVLSEQMKIAAEARDRVNRNNDLSLVFAEVIVRLEEVSNDG